MSIYDPGGMTARQSAALNRGRARKARQNNQPFTTKVNINPKPLPGQRVEGFGPNGAKKPRGTAPLAVANPQPTPPLPTPSNPAASGGNQQQQAPSRPVTTRIKIDLTPNKQVGKPAGVKAAEADKVAALAALAAEQRREDAAIRDAYSQNLMAAQSSAADMYGGRAPAILGQGVTGARRQYISGRSTMVQENIAERAALQRAYNEAIRQAYAAAAQQALDNARANSQVAMMASQTMGY